MIKYKETHNGEVVAERQFVNRVEEQSNRLHKILEIMEANGDPAEWVTEGVNRPDEFTIRIAYLFDNGEQWVIESEEVNE